MYVELYNKDELDLHFHFGTINKTRLLWWCTSSTE